MVAFDPNSEQAILQRLRSQAATDAVRVTQHAQQEMIAEAFTLDGVLYAVSNAELLENYPDHRRGACCLIHGVTETKRNVHIVCTTTQPLLIIITVYEPKPPKWPSPTERRRA